MIHDPAPDAELLARQSALQAGAAELLAGLDLAALVADIGPLLLAGSVVSGLMVWPEIDVMLLAGPDFAPPTCSGCWPGSWPGYRSRRWTTVTSAAPAARPASAVTSATTCR